MRARRVRVVLRMLCFEHPPGEVVALPDLARQDPVRVLKTERVRFRVEETDRRPRAEGRARSILQRVDDRPGVGHARQARRAPQEGAELGLLPRATEDLWRCEPDEIGDRGRERQHLSQPGRKARERRRQKRREAGYQDGNAEQNGARRHRLEPASRDASGASPRENECDRAVGRKRREVDDDRYKDRRRDRTHGHYERDRGKDHPGFRQQANHRRNVREIVHQSQQQIRHRDDEERDDVRDELDLAKSECGHDPGLDDGGRDRSEKEGDVDARPGSTPESGPGHQHEDQDVDRLRQERDELESGHAARF